MILSSSPSFIEIITSYDFYMLSLIPWAINEVLYTVVSGWFFYLDYTTERQQLKQWKLQSYKIKDDPSIPAFNWSKYRRCAMIALRNRMFGSSSTMMVFACFWVLRGNRVSDPFPSVLTMCYQIIVTVLIEEFLFYYLHRAVHSKFGFKHIHSVHHELDAPVAIGAVYCHFAEHICINIAPMMLGPLLSNAHWTLTWFWWMGAVVNTCCTHSGYNWKWLDAQKHDRHHQMTKCEFGVFGLLDRLHKTRYQDLAQNKQQVTPVDAEEVQSCNSSIMKED